MILESHPLLHFDSSHCPLARYTPRLERILPRYHSRFTPLHLPNARVPVDERYESTSPLPPLQPTFPSCLARLFTRSRPGKQRHDAFTTTHSYNRLTRLTKGRRKETRGHTLKAYGRPSTNDLENFLVLGPLDRLSRFLAGDRSRSISGPENCTSRTEYARNGKRTPRHRTGAIAASAINTTPSLSNSSGSSRRR